MFCTNCGTENREDASYCHNCGANLNRQREQTSPTYNYSEPGYAPAAQRSAMRYGAELEPEQGMKWFKFIIYVQLFLSMLSQVSSAILIFAGSQYGEDADYIYFLYDGLKAVDVIFGILSLGLAVLALAARQALARFKANGPKLYFTFLIANIVVGLIYIILVSIVTGVSMSMLVDTDLIAQLVTSAILLGVNIVYFRKRTHLFVN